jgi:hypothetical protein
MRIIALAALAALVGSLVNGGASLVGTVPAPAHAVGAAQQVFLDPVTGLPREPTEAEVAALAAAASSASAKAALRPGAAAPEEIHLPDGTAGIRLEQRYYETVTMCRQPDGSFGSRCPATGSAR